SAKVRVTPPRTSGIASDSRNSSGFPSRVMAVCSCTHGAYRKGDSPMATTNAEIPLVELTNEAWLAALKGGSRTAEAATRARIDRAAIPASPGRWRPGPDEARERSLHET